VNEGLALVPTRRNTGSTGQSPGGVVGIAMALAGIVWVALLGQEAWRAAMGPEGRTAYSFFDPRHALEAAYLLLLVAPAVVVLPFLRRSRDPTDRVLQLAAAGCVVQTSGSITTHR